jgi:hypothetical protein
MSISQAAWDDPTLSLWLRGFLREWPENSIAHLGSPVGNNKGTGIFVVPAAVISAR